MRPLDFYAHVTRSGQDALLSDLGPVIHAGTEASFELILGPAFFAQDTSVSYRWEWTAGSSSGTQNVSGPQRFALTIPAESSVTVTATELLNGTAARSVSGAYTITNDPAVASVWASGAALQRAITEITTDLAPFIRLAAASTGANGVTERFIAAVLLIEITNRPKSGRIAEINEVREEIVEIMMQRHRRTFFDRFNLNLFLHKSFGLGQTKMSTLAMALGWMRLIEHQRVPTRSSREDEIEAEFMSLTTDQMWELWRRLSWAKSATHSVATVLAHLKNRSNRYPGLTRSGFAASGRAMAIIGSEYNLGATNSPEASAGPTWYGETVRDVCNGVTGTGYLQASVPFAIFAHT